MKNCLILLVLLSIFISFDSISQSIKIVDIETREFPMIQILIETGGKEKLNFKELKIIENEEHLNYTIDSSISIAPQNMICFLIDENLQITNSSLNKTLEHHLSKRSSQNFNDLYNIVISKSNANSASCIFPISYEFSQAPKGLLNHYRNSAYIIHNNQEQKDLSCSIDSLISFINNKNIKISNKFLFVLKAPQTSCSDFNILKVKAEANLIELLAFDLYDESDSISNNPETIAINIIDSMLVSSKRKQNSSNSYLLSYYTSQTDNRNEFIIQYKGKNIISSFSNPQNQVFSASVLISIIVFLTVLFIIFFIYNRNRFRKSLIIDKRPKQKEVIKVKEKSNSTSITPSITIEYDNNFEKFELKKIRTTIGRHSDNDILIPHLTISNHHAIITNEGGVFYIQDNQSTNGVFVNDIKITKSKLSNGDNIRMGIAKLLLEY